MKKTFLIIALLGMGLVTSCGNKSEVETETTEVVVDSTAVEVEVEVADTTAVVEVADVEAEATAQ